MKKNTWLFTLLLLAFIMVTPARANQAIEWIDNLPPKKAVGDEYAFYAYTVEPATPQAELQKLADSLKEKVFPYAVVEVGILDNSGSPKALFKKMKGQNELETFFVSSTDEISEWFHKVGYKTSPLQMFDEFYTNAISAGDKYKDLMLKFTGVVKRVTASANGQEGCVVFDSERKSEYGSLQCCTPMDVPQALPLKDMKPGDKVTASGWFSHRRVADLNISGCQFSKGDSK